MGSQMSEKSQYFVFYLPLSLLVTAAKVCGVHLGAASIISLAYFLLFSGAIYYRSIEFIFTHFWNMLCRSVMSNSAMLWTMAHQNTLSIGFSRKKILEWVDPPGDLLDPETKPTSLMSSLMTVRFLCIHWTIVTWGYWGS